VKVISQSSSGRESSSPTLVGIRVSNRCSSGLFSAARIRSLWKKQNTSMTAISVPRNIKMVVNQIMDAFAHRPATCTAVGKNCQLGQIGKHRLVAFVETQVNGFPLLLKRHGGVLPDTQNTPPESPPALTQDGRRSSARGSRCAQLR
jgi:hypothetical protein